MSGVKGRSGGRRPRRALSACQVCGRPRVVRLRARGPHGGLWFDRYCRHCQARTGRAWRSRNTEKVAGYRLARKVS